MQTAKIFTNGRSQAVRLPKEYRFSGEEVYITMMLQQKNLEQQIWKKLGQPIGPLDTLIGAHALSLGCILVTNNVKELRRIKALQIENWIS